MSYAEKCRIRETTLEEVIIHQSQVDSDGGISDDEVIATMDSQVLLVSDVTN